MGCFSVGCKETQGRVAFTGFNYVLTAIDINLWKVSSENILLILTKHLSKLRPGNIAYEVGALPGEAIFPS